MYLPVTRIKVTSTAASGGQGPGGGAAATGAGAVHGQIRVPRGAEAAWPRGGRKGQWD